MKSALLQMKNIYKTFPGVNALVDVSFTVESGTIHALMGENGAGKSTLMKILSGLYDSTSGEIIFDGKPLDTSNMFAVLKHGISMIYQELNPLDNMLVAENIFLGKEPCKIKYFLIDKKKMLADAQKLLDQLGINVLKATDYVGDLSISQKQMLEIVKAVSNNSKLIIMDEPTSAITENECQRLFETINWLKEKGVTFIYITHKINEVFTIADKVTVLRDGEYVGTENVNDISQSDLVKMMIGRDISQIYPKKIVEIGDNILEVRRLAVNGLYKDVSFNARKGEIVGFAGLMGARRTEVMETLFGYRKADAGEISIRGKVVRIKSPRDAINKKIAFLTEDRRKTGCFLPLNVYRNAMMLVWKRYSKGILVNHRLCKSVFEEQISAYDVKTTGPNQIVRDLSGGNQQKLLLVRWLLSIPDIIILDEPTKGIDVGSKHEIYKEMCKLAKQGKTIIMVSSELPEILGMSDRIVVMHEGKVTGILNANEVDQEKVLRYAAGLVNKGEA